MLLRYIPVVWVRNYAQRCFTSHPLGKFSTIARARRAIRLHAERHPIVTTNGCFARDMNRAQFYDLFDARLGAHRRDVISSWQPEPEIVASVGEIGWTP